MSVKSRSKTLKKSTAPRTQTTDSKTPLNMSQVDATAQEIMNRVRTHLSPSRFSLKNESHLHKGHRGNTTGGGHYSIYIVSDSFEGLNALQRNRWIMELLKDLFPDKIHALKLKLKTEAEVPLLEEEAPKHTYGRTKTQKK